jgi:anaerobic selenocysteine-containing dehydrogenase
VGLIIGANPLVSLCPGLPQTGPKRWLRNARARGYRLIVIDPRRTETAAQSDLFLQTRPGHDAAIVAGLINIILQNGLEDKSFIDSDVMGFDALRSAVEAFNPDEVERRSGIPAADLIEAARLFATFHLEMIGMHAPGCGVAPWAHVTQPVVEPPSGSEVIEDWEFFYGLAQRLGLQLGLRPYGAGAHVDPVPLDMGVKPTSDDLLDILARDGRVPLAEVSSHLHGKNYDSIKEYVLPKDEGCTERLDVGAPSMLLELASIEVDAGAGNSTWAGEKFPFRMVCRRLNSRYNSTGHTFPSLIKSNPYNAAYMHPDDLDALGVVAGDEVVIANPMASVRALVEPDDTLRRGLVSIAHCWGSGVPGDDDPRSGAAISRLISVGDAFDPLTGQPIMSNVLVSVRPVARLSTDRL